jgi:hypothetical protein
LAVLLHAGPPLRGEPPLPLLNAAIQAILFEGLAETPGQARLLLASGDVALQPAQDHAVVTPLAQVVSASMPMMAVEQRNHVCYAPMLEGPAPALRFGSASPDCRQRLEEAAAWIEIAVAPVVRREPVLIDALVSTAVANGDECHARTAVANAALIACLAGLDGASIARLRANPAFVLTVLMAAAGAALRAHRSAVEAIGGNGIDFGIRLTGSDSWRQVPAEAPSGTRLPGREQIAALAAIGDSAVIDFCGLGGQALAAAPALLAEWRGTLPPDVRTRREMLIDPASGIADPVRIIRAGAAPLINLAILGREGEGLLGRGIYTTPLELFAGRP